MLYLLPDNYFVTLYCALYLLVPWLNRMLHSLTDRGYRRLVVTVRVLFSLQPTLAGMVEHLLGVEIIGLNMVSAYGDQSGYSIVNFLLCYLLGTGLHRIRRPRTGTLLAVVAGCVLLGALWRYGAAALDIAESAGKYNNPLVLCQAAACLLLFLGWQPGSVRLLNYLGEASFGVFLSHMFVLQFFDLETICGYPPLLMLAALLGVAAGIYLVCSPLQHLFGVLYRPVERAAVARYERRKRTRSEDRIWR